MKTSKRIILTLIIVTISISSCKKVREVLIPTRIEGVVTDAETGEPIPHSTVYLFRSFKGNEELIKTFTTNENGEFEIKEKLREYEYAGKDHVGYIYILLGENKPLFYTETINNKNTVGIDNIYYNQYRDKDATAVIEITRKNNVNLKLRKTGLIRFVAIDNPNIIADPSIQIFDIDGNSMTKQLRLLDFNEKKVELFAFPGWYKYKANTHNPQTLIDFEVKYTKVTEIVVEH